MTKSGKFFESCIYLIQYDASSELRLDDTKLVTDLFETILKKGGVVLWEFGGIFNLIPFPVIKNALQEHLIAAEVNRNYPQSIPGAAVISFHQGIAVPTEVAYALLASHEKPESLGDSDTPTGTGSEDQTIDPELNPG